jgi:hypothetical protein
VARDLQSNDITAELLTVAIVDHMTEDHGATAPVGQNAEDPSAPLLFLTPRVAHILQDVFGDTEAHAVSAVERVRRIMLAADAATRVESPPESAGGGGDAVNDSLPDFESVILSGPMTETFYDNENLPSFQRQMYRTDI